MLTWFSRARAPDPELDRLRNAAVLAWIRVCPDDGRLAAFLDGVAAGRRREVRRSARAIRKATEAFPGHRTARLRPDAASYHAALHDHLKARFPWMSDDTFATLKLYSDWSGWR